MTLKNSKFSLFLAKAVRLATTQINLLNFPSLTSFLKSSKIRFAEQSAVKCHYMSVKIKKQSGKLMLVV